MHVTTFKCYSNKYHIKTQCKKKKRERLRLLSRPRPITGPVCTCGLRYAYKNVEMGYLSDIDSD